MPFEKGKSGNPGGRPKESGHIKELARQHAPGAFARILELVASEDQRVALNAAQAVLDRAYGKPAQAIVGEDGGAIELVQTIRREIVTNRET